MAPRDTRQIFVAGSPAGMQGLGALFAALHAEGITPDTPDLGAELVKRAGKENYIPPSARAAFAEALLREYRAYVARLAAGESSEPRDYGTWQGYAREEIPWFPSINAELCDGCGACLKLCSHGALGPTPDAKVILVDPFACVVGCSSCATLCKPGAITFPPRSILQTYRRKG